MQVWRTYGQSKEVFTYLKTLNPSKIGIIYTYREKKRDLTQSHDKHQKTTDNAWVKLHKDATKTFDYTTITDRHRTVS